MPMSLRERDAHFQLTPGALRMASGDELLSTLAALQLWHSQASKQGRDSSSYITAVQNILQELATRRIPAPEMPIVHLALEKASGTYAAFRLNPEAANKLHEWAKGQGISNVVPPEKMHITTVYSTKAVPEYAPSGEEPKLEPPYSLGVLNSALVLYVEHPTLHSQHQRARDLGADWTYHSDYKPHVTLSYDPTGSRMQSTPDFPIQLAQEYSESLRPAWTTEEGVRPESKDFTIGDVHVSGGGRREQRKGFPNHVPEIGVHVHNLERENAITKPDGLHPHLFVLPDGSVVWSEEDGLHQHQLETPFAARVASGGRHRHKVMIHGVELWTEEDGDHEHQLQVWSSAFDGIHTHTLRIPAGVAGAVEDMVIENLTPGQYWEWVGSPSSNDIAPAEPASRLAKQVTPETYRMALSNWKKAQDLQMRAVREPMVFDDKARAQQLQLMTDAWTAIPSTQPAAWYPMVSALDQIKQMLHDKEKVTSAMQTYTLHLMEAGTAALNALLGAPHDGMQKAKARVEGDELILDDMPADLLTVIGDDSIGEEE